MSFLKEFRNFAMRGNVIDMAIGVIIGGAFGKIITSLVADVIMPALSVITGCVDIKSLAVTVESGNEAAEPIMISYGLFLQNIIDFLVIALCVFCAVSVMNKFNKKKDESKPAPAPSPEQELLAEIRDILKASK